jgi:hypothetical protein
MTTQFKSEAHLQSHCYQWAHNTFPDTRGLLFKVKNESENGIPIWIQTLLKKTFPAALALLQKNNKPYITGGQDKATGLVPGVADMLFLWKGNTYAFEFKFGNGKQSPAQKEWQQKVNGHIENYIIVNDAYAFMEFFKTIVTG